MIRIATPEDLPQILAIYGPYVRDTTHSFEYEIPTMAAFARRFEDITAQFPWLVWEENGKVLGYAYGSLPFSRAAYRWSCEASIYLAPQAQGKGIGRRLYAALEEILKRQGYQKVYAIITQENTGSIVFHEKLGYQFCAQMPGCGFKHGRWLGIVWLEKQLNFIESPHNFPVSWTSVVENNGKSCDILAILSLS